MEEVNKDTSEVIFDHLHSAAFQGTPLGRTILGPEENVKSITRDDLIRYIQTNYHPPRMVLSAAGGIKHEEIVALTEKYFGNLPQKLEATVRPKTNFTGSQVVVWDDTMEDAHLAIGVQGVSWSHPDYFAFMVFQTIIGNWDRTIGGGKNLTSKFCEIIATEKLAHSVTTFSTSYSDIGLFGTYFVLPPDRAEDAISTVTAEWLRIGKNVGAREVEGAKTKLKASVLMQLDGTTAVAEDIGRQLLTHGRRMSPAEIFLRIENVTPEDVSRIATEYCEDTEPVVAAIGPLENLPDYSLTRSLMYRNRF